MELLLRHSRLPSRLKQIKLRTSYTVYTELVIKVALLNFELNHLKICAYTVVLCVWFCVYPSKLTSFREETSKSFIICMISSALNQFEEAVWNRR